MTYEPTTTHLRMQKARLKGPLKVSSLAQKALKGLEVETVDGRKEREQYPVPDEG